MPRASGAINGLIHIGQNAPCIVEQRQSSIGERGLARLPGQDAIPQRALQLLDLLRQRRLRHAQSLGGAPEMQFLGDSHEVAELPQVDAVFAGAIHIKIISSMGIHLAGPIVPE